MEQRLDTALRFIFIDFGSCLNEVSDLCVPPATMAKSNCNKKTPSKRKFFVKFETKFSVA